MKPQREEHQILKCAGFSLCSRGFKVTIVKHVGAKIMNFIDKVLPETTFLSGPLLSNTAGLSVKGANMLWGRKI